MTHMVMQCPYGDHTALTTRPGELLVPGDYFRSAMFTGTKAVGEPIACDECGVFLRIADITEMKNWELVDE